MPVSEDYYQILGLTRQTPQEEIPRAYRELARKFHPDLNPDDQAAKEKFIEIKRAYDVLNDPFRRNLYDQYGQSLGGVAVHASHRPSSSTENEFTKQPVGNTEPGIDAPEDFPEGKETSWFPQPETLRAIQPRSPMQVLQARVLGALGLCLVVSILLYSFNRSTSISSLVQAENQASFDSTEISLSEEEFEVIDLSEQDALNAEVLEAEMLESEEKQSVSQHVDDDSIREQIVQSPKTTTSENVFSNEAVLESYDSEQFSALSQQEIQLPDWNLPETNHTPSSFHLPNSLKSDTSLEITRPWQRDDADEKENTPRTVPLTEGFEQSEIFPSKSASDWKIPQEAASFPITQDREARRLEPPAEALPAYRPLRRESGTIHRESVPPEIGYHLRGMPERNLRGDPSSHFYGEGGQRGPTDSFGGRGPFRIEFPEVRSLPGTHFTGRDRKSEGHRSAGFIMPWAQHAPSATGMFFSGDQTENQGGLFDFSIDPPSLQPENIYSRPGFMKPRGSPRSIGVPPNRRLYSPPVSSLPGIGRSYGSQGVRSSGLQSFEAFDNF